MCKRKDCLYIPPPTHKNGCDYAYLTDNLRNCPVEGCTRYRHSTQQQRLKYRTEIFEKWEEVCIKEYRTEGEYDG